MTDIQQPFDAGDGTALIDDSCSSGQPMPAELRTAIAIINKNWEAAQQLAKDFIRGARDACTGYLSRAANDVENQLEEIDRSAYRDVREAVIEALLTGCGVQLAYDDIDIRERFFGRRHRNTDGDLAFSPLKAADVLHADLAGKAVDMAKQQLANHLVRDFWLDRQTEVKRQRNRVILRRNAYLDDFEKKHSKRNRYSYNSQNDIVGTMTHLGQALTMLGLVGRYEEKAEFQRVSHAFREHEWEVSREFRPTFVGIELRCFQSHVDFYVPEAMATELNAFIGEFATNLDH